MPVFRRGVNRRNCRTFISTIFQECKNLESKDVFVHGLYVSEERKKKIAISSLNFIKKYKFTHFSVEIFQYEDL